MHAPRKARPYTLIEENCPTPDEWRGWALQCAPLHELLRRVRAQMQAERERNGSLPADFRNTGGATVPE